MLAFPVSSLKNKSRIYPTEIYFPSEKSALPKDSIAMVHQIRTVAKERLGEICGHIDDALLRENINSVMKEYFEL